MSIPSDESGSTTVNYHGKGGTITTLSAVDVIKNDLKELKIRLSFVGITRVGIYDMRATPVESPFPGVEIHATVVSHALQDRFILRDGRIIAVEILCLALFPVILALLLGIGKEQLSGAGCFFMFCFRHICCFQLLLFRNYSIDMSLLYPLSSTAMAFISSQAYRRPCGGEKKPLS